MNLARLKLWIEDLRTTTERQTSNVLHNERGFCCLGRLCEVAIADGVPVSVELRQHNGEHSYDNHFAMPPPVVRSWLFEGDDLDGTMLLASEWNDKMYLSFQEIADKLEAEFLT